jgi:hypothetical protein
MPEVRRSVARVTADWLRNQFFAISRPCPYSKLKTVNYRESLGIFLRDRRTLGQHDHHAICSLSVLSFRFRSRAALELELVGLRHQLIASRRQRPRRLRLHSADRLLWVCLHRVWPRVLVALVLAEPATVMNALRVMFAARFGRMN